MRNIILVPNASGKLGQPLDANQERIVGSRAAAEVHRYRGAFPIHAPTPLVELPALAASLGIAGLAVKDEGQRDGLFSFKALGGAYAVARLVHRFLEQHLGRSVDPAEMRSSECNAAAAQLTVCCATDGNHGRSVAAGARMFGCRCVIFLHGGVSEGREKAIAALGAEIRRTEGSYDQSVAEASETARRDGWITVSDFSWPGYEEIPGLVMQGYTLMLEEIFEQSVQPYSHVFVQGGVGGLAAVVAGHFLDRLGARRPTVAVVEPERANCLQRSAQANRRIAMEPGASTVMAMLECYEPSLIAWEILEKAADVYVAVPDGLAIEAMRRLARPLDADPALVIGESGGAGLAGLMAVAADPSARQTLGMDGKARVLIIGTEGATDPDLYRTLIDAGGEATEAAQREAQT